VVVNKIEAGRVKAEQGSARLGMARQGLFDKRNSANAVNIISARQGWSWHVGARRGAARRGVARQGKELLINAIRLTL
jgi:hypothetical protein